LPGPPPKSMPAGVQENSFRSPIVSAMMPDFMDPLTRIEAATLDDLPALTELLMELFAQESDFRPDYNTQMRGLRLILEQPNRGRIFVLRGAQQLIGMINLLFTISTAEGGFVILLEDLVVHRNFRRQGFGGQLLEYAINFARQKDFLRVTLLTDRVNTEESVRFFERHNFQRSEMIPMRLWLGSAAEWRAGRWPGQ
jgi:GNAT superfamily N-acetyltransferase